MLGELLHHRRDRRLLLTDRHVEAEHVLPLLVDDRVDRDGRLSGLTVTDDELALTTADRDHGVDRLDACLERLLDRLTTDDARRLQLDAARVLRVDRALAVDGLTERVHHATDERLADGDLHDAARALDALAFADAGVGAEDRDTDVVLFEVEDHAHHAAVQLDELTGHGALEAVHARDAVTDGEHGAGLGDVDRLVVSGDLLLDDVGDLFGAKLHRLLRGRAGGGGNRPVGAARFLRFGSLTSRKVGGVRTDSIGIRSWFDRRNERPRGRSGLNARGADPRAGGGSSGRFRRTPCRRCA